jgi:hypothetical protein
MPLQEKLNFEERLELSFKDYLTSNGVSNVYTSFSKEDYTDERVEIRIEVGAAEEHFTKVLSPVGDQDIYDISLIISVFTDADDKTDVTGFFSRHAYRKSLLRKLLLQSSLNGDIADVIEFMPPEDYDIAVFRKQNETGDIKDDNVIFSEFFYTFKILVRLI